VEAYSSGIFRVYRHFLANFEDKVLGFDAPEVSRKLAIFRVGTHIHDDPELMAAANETKLKFSTWEEHISSLESSAVPEAVPPSWNDGGGHVVAQGWSSNRHHAFPLHQFVVPLHSYHRVCS
jgi:hypothetical protein